MISSSGFQFAAVTSGFSSPVETAVHAPSSPLSPHRVLRNVPAASSCEPTKVAIAVETTVVIPDYARYYPNTPLSSFNPSYYALDDGSLIASPFVHDMFQANLSLLILSMMSILFIRNVFVTGDYLFRRSKIIKIRFLFHLLFASQLLGLVGITPSVLAYFSESIDCTAVMVAAAIAGFLSLAMIVTCILGFKAYKCLNNSRFIPVILALFQTALTATTILEVRGMLGERRLSGSCIRVTPLFFTTASAALQFGETLFICLCFGVAIWRSRGSPSQRCRISLHLSMDNIKDDDCPLESANSARPLVRSRGWWDYVPEPENRHSPVQMQSYRMLQLARSGFGLFAGDKSLKPQVYNGPGRKPSVTSDTPLSQPPRRHPSVQFDETKETEKHNNRSPVQPSSSPVPSSSSRFSRFSRLIPRMELFQKVLKDELFYTTSISCTCLIAVVFSLIGLNVNNSLTVVGWQSLNWAIISVVVTHSFERALRRHENDALIIQATRDTGVPKLNQPTPRQRGINSVSVSTLSNRRMPRFGLRQDIEQENENPFSDTQRLTQSCSSMYTLTSASRSSSPTHKDEDPKESLLISPVDVPTSAYKSPAVNHSSVDSTFIPGLPKGWTPNATGTGPGSSSPLAAHYSSPNS